MRRDDQFSTAGDGRGGVGTRNTKFYSYKVHFFTDRHDEGFLSYRFYFIAPPAASSCSRIYSFDYYDGSSFFLNAGDCRYGMDPSNTHFPSHKELIVGLMVVILCHIGIVIINP